MDHKVLKERKRQEKPSGRHYQERINDRGRGRQDRDITSRSRREEGVQRRRGEREKTDREKRESRERDRNNSNRMSRRHYGNSIAGYRSEMHPRSRYRSRSRSPRRYDKSSGTSSKNPEYRVQSYSTSRARDHSTPFKYERTRADSRSSRRLERGSGFSRQNRDRQRERSYHSSGSRTNYRREYVRPRESSDSRAFDHTNVKIKIEMDSPPNSENWNTPQTPTFPLNHGEENFETFSETSANEHLGQSKLEDFEEKKANIDQVVSQDTIAYSSNTQVAPKGIDVLPKQTGMDKAVAVSQNGNDAGSAPEELAHGEPKTNEAASPLHLVSAMIDGVQMKAEGVFAVPMLPLRYKRPLTVDSKPKPVVQRREAVEIKLKPDNKGIVMKQSTHVLTIYMPDPRLEPFGIQKYELKKRKLVAMSDPRDPRIRTKKSKLRMLNFGPMPESMKLKMKKTPQGQKPVIINSHRLDRALALREKDSRIMKKKMIPKMPVNMTDDEIFAKYPQATSTHGVKWVKDILEVDDAYLEKRDAIAQHRLIHGGMTEGDKALLACKEYREKVFYRKYLFNECEHVLGNKFEVMKKMVDAEIFFSGKSDGGMTPPRNYNEIDLLEYVLQQTRKPSWASTLGNVAIPLPPRT